MLAFGARMGVVVAGDGWCWALADGGIVDAGRWLEMVASSLL
jgi:hypothetical protein